MDVQTSHIQELQQKHRLQHFQKTKDEDIKDKNMKDKNMKDKNMKK